MEECNDYRRKARVSGKMTEGDDMKHKAIPNAQMNEKEIVQELLG